MQLPSKTREYCQGAETDTHTVQIQIQYSTDTHTVQTHIQYRYTYSTDTDTETDTHTVQIQIQIHIQYRYRYMSSERRPYLHASHGSLQIANEHDKLQGTDKGNGNNQHRHQHPRLAVPPAPPKCSAAFNSSSASLTTSRVRLCWRLSPIASTIWKCL